jgi:hypothetical protein
MSKADSPYYPPRARWYSGVLTDLDKIRRHLMLDRLRPPASVPIGQALIALLVPGLGFWLRGVRIWGYLAVGACLVCGCWFVVDLGHPGGNTAFGLLVSIHAMSLGYLLEPCLGGAEFRYRILFSLAVLIALGCAVYLPARNYLQTHWFMPLRVADKVVVVQSRSSPGRLQRGDVIAYRYEGFGDHGWYVRDGMGCAPILALAGDRVVFSTNGVAVNGRAHPLQEHMPQAGDLVVGQNQWLIWPQVGIHGGHVGEAVISAALLRVAPVDHTNFVGKPYRRWFWREQEL